MQKIFLSYRREDSAATCGRIYDRLKDRFGKETVFKDVDSIPLGVAFPDYIAGVMRQCGVQLVVIGPHFADVTDAAGRARLDDPDDFVRVEVESGLERFLSRETVVVPVLVQGASMPDPRRLPESLRLLVRINGQPVRYDPDFDGDMHRLISQIERWLGVAPAAPTATTSPSQPASAADPRAAQLPRLIAEARAAYDAGHVSDAVLKAELALTLPGGEFDVTLWRLLAAGRRRLNAPTEALTALDRAQALAPLDDIATRLAILSERRAIQAEQQQWPAALATLQDELRLTPDDPARLEILADLQEKTGHPQDALTTLRRLTARADAPTTAWLARARLALDAKDAADARVALDAAARLTPNDPALAPLRAALDKRFPQRLSELGFTARKERDVAYILPPLCPVPAGPFLMGSDPRRDPQAFDQEQPQHSVTLPAYQIARFPVTVAEYACFVRACFVRDVYVEPPKGPYGVDWATQLQRLDHPVTCVRWHDAVAYAAWLAQITGQPWRLPSEAEWEKAARGTDGRVYPWGNSFDTARGNTSENVNHITTPVGAYPGGASPCGALDMAGNVGEWTVSIFTPYPYRQNDGREDRNSTEHRVLRGVSWGGDSARARAAYRGHNLPSVLVEGIGFRVALAVAARAGS